MTLDRARLTIEADVTGGESRETGIFEMAGNLEIRPGIQPNFTLGGQGSTLSSIIGSVSDGSFGGQREGLFLDLGAGQHTVEISFLGWEGSTDADGNDLQWGNTGDSSQLTQADATGAAAMTQMDVLMRYLTEGRIDSTNPATLEYGEYSQVGLYEPLNVVVKGPNFENVAQDGSWFTGTMVCVSAAAIDETGEQEERNDYG